jgi:predicted ATP-grasp superfamily ATP-dependent carboligase
VYAAVSRKPGSRPTCSLIRNSIVQQYWSRAATAIKTTALHRAELITNLRSIGLPEGTVLIITDELALLRISEHRAQLTGRYRLHLPSHDMVMTLQDKALFHKFAVANGLPVLLPYLVTVLLSPSANAVFTVLWMVVVVALIIPSALATVLFPVIQAEPHQYRNRMTFRSVYHSYTR